MPMMTSLCPVPSILIDGCIIMCLVQQVKTLRLKLLEFQEAMLKDKEVQGCVLRVMCANKIIIMDCIQEQLLPI